MRMQASVYAVIATREDGSRERIADFDTREAAEDRARAENDYSEKLTERFEVRLLDRRPSAKRAIPEGVLLLLKGATPAERQRALEIYQ